MVQFEHVLISIANGHPHFGVLLGNPIIISSHAFVHLWVGSGWVVHVMVYAVVHGLIDWITSLNICMSLWMHVCMGGICHGLCCSSSVKSLNMCMCVYVCVHGWMGCWLVDVMVYVGVQIGHWITSLNMLHVCKHGCLCGWWVAHVMIYAVVHQCLVFCWLVHVMVYVVVYHLIHWRSERSFGQWSGHETESRGI